jgi:hypothetical protein
MPHYRRSLPRRDRFERDGFFFFRRVCFPVFVMVKRKLDDVSAPVVTIGAIGFAQHTVIGCVNRELIADVELEHRAVVLFRDEDIDDVRLNWTIAHVIGLDEA